MLELLGKLGTFCMQNALSNHHKVCDRWGTAAPEKIVYKSTRGIPFPGAIPPRRCHFAAASCRQRFSWAREILFSDEMYV